MLTNYKLMYIINPQSIFDTFKYDNIFHNDFIIYKFLCIFYYNTYKYNIIFDTDLTTLTLTLCDICMLYVCMAF